MAARNRSARRRAAAIVGGTRGTLDAPIGIHLSLTVARCRRTAPLHYPTIRRVEDTGMTSARRHLLNRDPPTLAAEIARLLNVTSPIRFPPASWHRSRSVPRRSPQPSAPRAGAAPGRRRPSTGRHGGVPLCPAQASGGRGAWPW